MARRITVDVYMTPDGFGVLAKYPGPDIEEDDPDDFWKDSWISKYDSVDTIIFGRGS